MKRNELRLSEKAAGTVTSRKALNTLLIALFLAVILFVAFMNRIVVTIYSGEAGVIYDIYKGTDLSRIYDEGVHFIFPLNDMYIYNTRVQSRTEEVNAFSKHGLIISVRVTVRFHPIKDDLPQLHKFIGPDYYEKIVSAVVKHSTRMVIGQYTGEELYHANRLNIQKEILDEVHVEMKKAYVHIENILIENLDLPDMIKVAIENKMAEQQAYLEYEFRLKTAKLESDRLEVEAEGIKKYNDILSAGLSEKVIKWKGIEETLKMSKSKNQKVIFVGGSKGSTPLILNLQEQEKESLKSERDRGQG